MHITIWMSCSHIVYIFQKICCKWLVHCINWDKLSIGGAQPSVRTVLIIRFCHIFVQLSKLGEYKRVGDPEQIRGEENQWPKACSTKLRTHEIEVLFIGMPVSLNASQHIICKRFSRKSFCLCATPFDCHLIQLKINCASAPTGVQFWASLRSRRPAC